MGTCFGAAWEVYVQGAFLAWERVLAHCRERITVARGERGKTPVAAHIVPHAVFLQAQCRPNAAPCRLSTTQTPLLAVLLQAKCSSVPSFHRPNAAPCRLFAAHTPQYAVFSQPTRRSTPTFHRPNAAVCRLFAAQTHSPAVFSQPKRSRTPSFRRLFASFNVHKFSIWTTDDIALRYSLTCYNVFTYQNSGKNVSVGPRDMFATCCFFLTSTNMVQCNQSC